MNLICMQVYLHLNSISSKSKELNLAKIKTEIYKTYISIVLGNKKTLSTRYLISKIIRYVVPQCSAKASIPLFYSSLFLAIREQPSKILADPATSVCISRGHRLFGIHFVVVFAHSFFNIWHTHVQLSPT